MTIFKKVFPNISLSILQIRSFHTKQLQKNFTFQKVRYIIFSLNTSVCRLTCILKQRELSLEQSCCLIPTKAFWISQLAWEYTTKTILQGASKSILQFHHHYIETRSEVRNNFLGRFHKRSLPLVFCLLIYKQISTKAEFDVFDFKPNEYYLNYTTHKINLFSLVPNN